MLIRDVLAAKSRAGANANVITIGPDATVRELLGLLAEHNVGALVVSTDQQAVDGIVSERDVVRRLVMDEAVLDAEVASIMTSMVASCESGDAVSSLMQLMTDRRIRHVPVVDDGRLVGVVSIGDVVKSRIGQLEFERDQLDSYVHQT